MKKRTETERNRDWVPNQLPWTIQLPPRGIIITIITIRVKVSAAMEAAASVAFAIDVVVVVVVVVVVFVVVRRIGIVVTGIGVCHFLRNRNLNLTRVISALKLDLKSFLAFSPFIYSFSFINYFF